MDANVSGGFLPAASLITLRYRDSCLETCAILQRVHRHDRTERLCIAMHPPEQKRDVTVICNFKKHFSSTRAYLSVDNYFLNNRNRC